MLLDRILFLPTILATFLVSAHLNAQDIKIATGEPIHINKEDIWISPPAEWEIIEDQLGKALILQEKKSEEVVYSKPTYQRNITMAVAHEGSPIDEITVQELRENLTKSFGKYGKDFTLSAEHEYFDYRKKKDGIIIYSFLKVNGFDLTQIHVFVSGEEQSVLLTYTDLSDRFQEDKGMFTTAWNTLASVQVIGEPSQRFAGLYIAAEIIGSIVLLLGTFNFVRNYRAKKAYEMEEDALFSDDEATLDDGEINEIDDENDDGFDFNDDLDHDDIPETKFASAQPATSW